MGPALELSSVGIFLKGGVALAGVEVSSQEGGSRRPQRDCEGIFWLKKGQGMYRDFVLSREVGCFTQQLCLRHSEDTRCGADEHRVVEPGIARSRWQEIPPLQGSGLK